MKRLSEISVTLSVELLGQLRARADSLDVSLEWLVAGLVCDIIERFFDVGLTTPA